MSTKIGFNNFKAFGSKMQYFSKKPITLIYGPNSVGKSSLIRALLFKEYLKTKRSSIFYTSKSNIDSNESLIEFLKKETPFSERNYLNITTDSFGDSYNIGTFESLIHKRDVSQNVNYDIQYNINDTLEILSYNRSFSGFLSASIENMKSIDSDLDFINLFNLYMLSKYYEKDEELENDIQACGYDVLFIEMEKRLINICAIDSNSLSKKENIKTLDKFIDFTKLQFNIASFQIKTSVNKELLQEHKFFINNELLFECKELDFNKTRVYDIKLYTNTEAFKKVFFNSEEQRLDSCIEFKNFEINVEIMNLNTVFTLNTKINSIYDIALYYEDYIKSTLYVIMSRALYENSEFKNIYLGPLRSVPQRTDFKGKKGFFKKQRRKQRLIEKNEGKCLRKLYVKFERFKDNKFLKFISAIAREIIIILCVIKTLVATLFNSIMHRGDSLPKFIKPNSKNYLKLWFSMVENKKVSKKISEWLKDKGKHNSSYTINNDYSSFSFFDESTQTNVHPQDMGVGISQSLPILISSALYKYTDIFIEQPELHLHPKLQMELADEFIKSYKENGNNYILETHSEHILLRLMKRMRHTDEKVEGRDKSLDLTPDDICLLYVDNNGKTTYIKELELDTDGTLLDPWPNGFFEEGYKERLE